MHLILGVLNSFSKFSNVTPNFKNDNNNANRETRDEETVDIKWESKFLWGWVGGNILVTMINFRFGDVDIFLAMITGGTFV